MNELRCAHCGLHIYPDMASGFRTDDSYWYRGVRDGSVYCDYPALTSHIVLYEQDIL